MDITKDSNKTKSKNLKDYININLKKKIWLKYFNESLYGECQYCKNKILIPKIVFQKLYPNKDINDFDDYIPKHIIGTHFDHKKSEFNNGKTNINNLQPICSICNLKKNKKNANEFEKLSNLNYKHEYNIDFMDIDTDTHKCKGVILDKNSIGHRCNNKNYFICKCVTHMYQNITY